MSDNIPPCFSDWIPHNQDKTPTIQETRDALDEALCHLVEKHDEYLSLLMAMKITLDWSPPNPDGSPSTTLGVTEKGELFINPWYFNNKELSSRIGLLLHECDHILYNHLEDIKMYSNANRANCAFDLEVNSHNKHVPVFRYSRAEITKMTAGHPVSPDIKEALNNPRKAYGLHPTHFGMREGRISKEYYDDLPMKDEDLQKKLQNMGRQGSSKGQANPDPNQPPTPGQSGGSGRSAAPQHTWLQNSTGKQALKQLVEEFAENCQGRGTLPASMEAMLKRVKTEKEIPWYIMLRRLARKYLAGNRGYQFKRPDRRTGYLPGRHRLKKHQIILVVDVSGSTSCVRNLFAAELMNIHRQSGAEIIVVEIDTKVTRPHYKFDGKMPKSFHGYGGTTFAPAFQYVYDNKLKCSLLIFLTDGWGENPPKPSHVTYPVIWATTDAKPAAWGHIVKIK